MLEAHLHNPHDSHIQEQQPHELRSTSQMDQEHHVMMNESHLNHGAPLTPQNDGHIPHGAPLTPQLTPVSQLSGLSNMVSTDADTIKTEVRTKKNLSHIL